MSKAIYREALKYLGDILFASIALTILAFPMLVIAFLIKIDSKGPVFFKSRRIGKNGKAFYMNKFRTMIDNAINYGMGIETHRKDPRITRVGRYLRNWSLDEIPQFLNVLKGEMSIVGPRPALPHQVEKYSDFEKKRLLVKPGITGWAQVNGRNLLSWQERIKLDVWYVENCSFWLDFKILLITLKVVFLGEGLYGQSGAVKDYE